MAEALDTLELAAAHAAAAADDDDKFPLNDLPNDLLVSVFEAVGDLFWVRHTVPLVCKAWNELYRSQDASPLHETLEVNFREEIASAAAREGGEARGGFDGDSYPVTAAAQEWARRHPVHASRVISWTERRAGWVRKLRLLEGGYCPGAFEDFSSEDVGRLVAVAASSLTEIRIGDAFGSSQDVAPFWEALRASVARHGRLRSLVVKGRFADVSESDVEPLGQLAGSLEELELINYEGMLDRLRRFTESFCALTELRSLALYGHRITAIPAQISSLKKLKELEVCKCCLSSLPKELGELSGLTALYLAANENLGNAPQDEAFPAALGRMKSLRELSLSECRLRAVPAFVGELESLEDLDLSENRELGNAPQDEAFPAELGRMDSLRELDLSDCDLSTVPAFVGELESLTKLDLAGNENLGTAPQDEAFPAALGRMKSLRELNLCECRLRTVPAFVGELESLEVIYLSRNYGYDMQIDATLDLLIEGCPRLREVWLNRAMTAGARAHLEAFKAKLLAQNPDAQVIYD